MSEEPTTSPEEIVLPPEQAAELQALVAELRKTELSLTSLGEILAQGWLSYLQMLSFNIRIKNAAGQSRMRQQMGSERRKWVRFLHQQVKHSPTPEGAVASWPQLAAISPALTEAIRQDLARLDRPVPRRPR